MANFNSKNVLLVGLKGDKGDTGDPAQLVNTTGQATDKAMTQKAVTDNLNEANKKIYNLTELLKGNAYTVNQGTSPAYSHTVPTGAQKYAELAKVGGKSVVWNQLLENGNFESTSGWVCFAPSTASLSVANNTATVTSNYAGGGGDPIAITHTTAYTVIGHKYLYLTDFVLVIGTELTPNVEHGTTTKGLSLISGTTYGAIISAVNRRNEFYIKTNGTKAVGDSWQFSNIRIIDLTQMFGAGNEPSQLTDEKIAFIKAYALAHPEYNAGAIVSGKCDKVVTKKANTTQIAEYAIPAAVQALTGYGESAGTAYNYVDYNTKKFVKKVGKVDLGSLSWSIGSTTSQFRANILDSKYILNNTDKIGLCCSKYPTWYPVIQIVSQAYGIAKNNHSPQVIVYDPAYTDPAAFKAAMSGVYLYYELATPVETDISAYLSDDNFIETEAGGTVTFHQQNQLPIYNEVNYMVKIEETL